MSVGRDVIADVNRVDKESVKCSKCSGFSNGYCKFWEQFTDSDSFCSFWVLKEEKEHEDD